jgi:hypothetical protein
MRVCAGDTQGRDDGIDGRFQDHNRAVGVGTTIVFVGLAEEVRVHGLEAHDAIEAGLLDAQPLPLVEKGATV